MTAALPLLGVNLEQQTVVVEHLFEMRNLPLAIGGVPVKTAGQLIEDASPRHLVEGETQHARGRRLLVSNFQEKQKIGWRWKLGRTPKPAPSAIE